MKKQILLFSFTMALVLFVSLNSTPKVHLGVIVHSLICADLADREDVFNNFKVSYDLFVGDLVEQKYLGADKKVEMEVFAKMFPGLKAEALKIFNRNNIRGKYVCGRRYILTDCAKNLGTANLNYHVWTLNRSVGGEFLKAIGALCFNIPLDTPLEDAKYYFELPVDVPSV